MNLNGINRPWIVLALGILYLGILGQGRGAEQSGTAQRTFGSSSDAGRELMQAVKAHDRHALRDLFGPEVTNLWTGDSVLDDKHFEAFSTFVAERCDVVAEGPNRATLEIGRDPWPFPIPLVRTNGVWWFDTVAGEEEILNRIIGRNEYYAIGVCRAYVRAQREYAGRFSAADGSPKYAMRLRSSPGKRDGLFWGTEGKELPSPLGPLVADASSEGHHRDGHKAWRPFHGYCFKILTRQGVAAPGGALNYIRNGEMTAGFALVAYPVRWGESGIMTFIVNQDGVVYQRSLGEKTAGLAAAMKEYNPDKHWTVAPEPGISDLRAGAPAGKPG